MKVITYELKKIEEMARIINSIQLKGFENARALTKVGDILDSGKIGEVLEEMEENRNDSNATAKNQSKRYMAKDI